MFSADFDYYRAGSVAEAGQLLAAQPGAKLLAGGHSLIPLLKLRLAAPEAVIDIGRIAELRGISTSGETLRIGSLTTHAEIAASADVKRHAAALAEAAGSDRRPRGAQSGHHRRERGPRRPGVRPPDRARGAGRDPAGHRAGGRTLGRRCRLLPRA